MQKIKGIIHDINNKLTVSKGLTKKISRGADSCEKDIDRLNATLSTCAELLKQLHSVTESETCCSNNSFENFSNLVEDQKSDLLYLSDLYAIDIDYHFDTQENCWFEGSKQHLSRIITNGIENAKHAKASRVLLEFQQADEFLLINIKDNGVGMSEEQLAKVGFGFTTQSGEFHGTGTQVIREMANHMNGSVKWTSIKGLGTCCSLKLTLVDNPNIKQEEQGNLFEAHGVKIPTPHKIMMV